MIFMILEVFWTRKVKGPQPSSGALWPPWAALARLARPWPASVRLSPAPIERIRSRLGAGRLAGWQAGWQAGWLAVWLDWLDGRLITKF